MLKIIESYQNILKTVKILKIIEKWLETIKNRFMVLMAPNGSDSSWGRLLNRSASGSLFLAFWSRSGRFRDLRPAKAAARRAGHHGLISSLN